MRLAFVAILMGVSSCATAAEYPEPLIGKYVSSDAKDKNACQNPQIVIEKTARYNDVDASCAAARVTSEPNKFQISENCGREDAKWTQTTTFELGAGLNITEKSKYQGETKLRLRSCGPAKQAAVAPAPAAKIMTCKVEQGAAGVATYHDETMKKVATDPIRDFDGYTFKAEKTVARNGVKLLAGKLIRSDGKVSAGAYALADEWTCR